MDMHALISTWNWRRRKKAGEVEPQTSFTVGSEGHTEPQFRASLFALRFVVA